MFRFGLFDKPQAGTWDSSVRTPEHAAFSLQAAEQGTVLLKKRTACCRCLQGIDRSQWCWRRDETEGLRRWQLRNDCSLRYRASGWNSQTACGSREGHV